MTYLKQSGRQRSHGIRIDDAFYWRGVNANKTSLTGFRFMNPCLGVGGDDRKHETSIYGFRFLRNLVLEPEATGENGDKDRTDFDN